MATLRFLCSRRAPISARTFHQSISRVEKSAFWVTFGSLPLPLILIPLSHVYLNKRRPLHPRWPPMVIALFYLPIFPLCFFVPPYNQLQTALFHQTLTRTTPVTLLTGSCRFQFVGWPIAMVQWGSAGIWGTGRCCRGDASRATEAHLHHHHSSAPPLHLWRGRATPLFHKHTKS